MSVVERGWTHSNEQLQQQLTDVKCAAVCCVNLSIATATSRRPLTHYINQYQPAFNSQKWAGIRYETRTQQLLRWATLATVDMGRKERGAVPLSREVSWSPSNTMWPGPKWAGIRHEEKTMEIRQS